MPNPYLKPEKTKTTSQKKADVTKRIHALNGTARRFSASHPFWEEAVQLRQDYYSYQYIADRARVLGYSDLTVQALRAGLAYAQKVLMLPAKGGNYLQRRYQQITADFDAVATLKYLIGDVIDELQDIDEALVESDLTDEQQISLLVRRDEVRHLAHDWTREFTEFQVRVEEVNIDKQRAENEGSRPTLRAYLDQIVSDITPKLQPPDPALITGEYGVENVRFPLNDRLEYVDAEEN